MRAVRTTIRPALGVSLAASLGLVFIACSGRSFDRDLVTETSNASVDDRPNAPSGRHDDDGTTTRRSSPPEVEEEDEEEDAGPPIDCDAEACDLPSAKGFTLVLFGDRSARCPSAWKSVDIVENPVAKAGACSCGACTAPIDCSSGTIASFYDDGDGKCDERGKALRANGGACNDQEGRLGENASVAAPRAVVGGCSAEGVPSRSAVATTSMRVCAPKPSTCPDAACDVPAGMQVCLVAQGDVDCPSHVPVKHLVGKDFTMACAACDCTVDATCDGTMSFYAKKGCKGAPLQRLDAFECSETNRDRFASTRWRGGVGAVRCRKDSPPPPTLGVSNARTVCCA